MTNNQPIGVFDSGVGGLTVLESLLEYFPSDDFIYIADHGHCPYGVKKPEEIMVRVVTIGKYLLSRGVKAIVIACNTASIFKEYLQELTDIPVISVIQPTSDCAIDFTVKKRVGVIGTVTTINSGIYQKLIKEKNIFVEGVACSEFVDIIENDEIENETTINIVKEKLSHFISLDIDTLIYGCTHFSLLEEQIKSILGPLNYISSGNPTSKYLFNLLSEKSSLSFEKEKRTVEIYTTGQIEKLISNMKWFKKDHKPVQKLNI